jgi:hypothetical protein
MTEGLKPRLFHCVTATASVDDAHVAGRSTFVSTNFTGRTFLYCQVSLFQIGSVAAQERWRSKSERPMAQGKDLRVDQRPVEKFVSFTPIDNDALIGLAA